MIGGFELLGNTLSLHHLLYKKLEHFLRLLIYVGKITVQLTAGQQVGIAHTALLLEIAAMPLPPYPDWLLFRLILSGNQVVVTDQLIFQPSAFIGNVLFPHQCLHPHNIDF